MTTNEPQRVDAIALIHAKKLVQVYIGTRAFVPQESIDKFVDRLQAEAAVDDSA